MHILAWIVTCVLLFGILFIFCYETFTVKGKINKILHPSYTKPEVHITLACAIAYLFYYYFGF